MSMETCNSYKVTSPIRFGGKVRDIDATVSLTDAEAVQFAGCIEPCDPGENAGEEGKFEAMLRKIQVKIDAVMGRHFELDELDELFKQGEQFISDLQTQLGKECEAKHNYKNDLDKLTLDYKVLLEDKEDLATQVADRDKAITDLTAQIAELQKAPAPANKK